MLYLFIAGDKFILIRAEVTEITAAGLAVDRCNLSHHYAAAALRTLRIKGDIAVRNRTIKVRVIVSHRFKNKAVGRSHLSDLMRGKQFFVHT